MPATTHQRNTSTRRAVTEALFDLAEKDEKVVLVSSDSVGVIKAQDFVEKYPDRVIEAGISEQAAVDCAAGLASTGLKPVYVTYAVFASMRACEQIRSIVSYTGLNVTIIGANGGMGSGEREGVSHQGCEDIGILRTFPGITILVPADAGQVRKAIVAAAGIDEPVYLRIGSGKEKLLYDDAVPFEIGPPRIIIENGKDVTIFGCGFILPYLQEACELLAEKGIQARAVEVPTIKPLDTTAIEKLLSESKAAVTVEDHAVYGGLGSAIAEVNVQSTNKPMRMVAIRDVFPESGTAEELHRKYGITAEAIVESALELL